MPVYSYDSTAAGALGVTVSDSYTTFDDFINANRSITSPLINHGYSPLGVDLFYSLLNHNQIHQPIFNSYFSNYFARVTDNNLIPDMMDVLGRISDGNFIYSDDGFRYEPFVKNVNVSVFHVEENIRYLQVPLLNGELSYDIDAVFLAVNPNSKNRELIDKLLEKYFGEQLMVSQIKNQISIRGDYLVRLPNVVTLYDDEAFGKYPSFQLFKKYLAKGVRTSVSHNALDLFEQQYRMYKQGRINAAELSQTVFNRMLIIRDE
jgi:hypothetical protein